MQHRKNYDYEDITGERFGRLLTIKKIEGSQSRWLFKCDCGNDVELPISRVLGRQRSCGCLRRETAVKWVKSHTTHGQSRTKLYKKWRSMIERCYRKDNRKYKRYGGRGITVCEEWRTSFEAFRDWAYSTGYNPEKADQSIERINNDRGYSPDNCRWATPYEQQLNRAVTKVYPYKGKNYTASEFADKFGITDKSFVYRRIKANGQSLEYILNDWRKIHNVPNHLIEVKEYAKFTGVTSAHIRRLINAGKVKGEKVGRKWYVHKSELDILTK